MTDRHYPTGNSTQDVRILAEKLWNAIENVQTGNGGTASQSKLASGGGSVPGSGSGGGSVYPTDHEALGGLQGGSAGEHYHLTSAQLALLSSLSANKFGIQCSVVDAAETVTVSATYQRHIIDTFTVYGTEIVNGVTYTFGLR